MQSDETSNIVYKVARIRWINTSSFWQLNCYPSNNTSAIIIKEYNHMIGMRCFWCYSVVVFEEYLNCNNNTPQHRFTSQNWFQLMLPVRGPVVVCVPTTLVILKLLISSLYILIISQAYQVGQYEHTWAGLGCCCSWRCWRNLESRTNLAHS